MGRHAVNRRGVRVLTVLTALVLLPAMLTGCGRTPPVTMGPVTVDAADREPLPPISGMTMDGDQLTVADLRGRVVVLNNWASWCAPCRAEIPAFVALAESADPADVAVVGLNVDDEAAAAAGFVQEFGVTYPSIVDADGTLLPTIPGVPPSSLPSTVILDRQGRIAARIIGATDEGELASLVASIAAEPALG